MVSRKKKAGLALGAVGGAIVGGGFLLANSNKTSSSSSKKSSEDASTDSSGEGSSSDSSGSSSSSSSSGGDGETKTKTVKQVVEVPIDNYEEAMEFATREWHKCQRDDGRQLDCTVQGATNWQVGEWSRVILPSFEIEKYMYIIRASHTNDEGQWSTQLSLVDYPPGWGEEVQETEEDTGDDTETDDTEGESEDSENSEDGETSGDGSE